MIIKCALSLCLLISAAQASATIEKAILISSTMLSSGLNAHTLYILTQRPEPLMTTNHENLADVETRIALAMSGINLSVAIGLAFIYSKKNEKSAYFLCNIMKKDPVDQELVNKEIRSAFRIGRNCSRVMALSGATLILGCLWAQNSKKILEKDSAPQEPNSN